MKNIRVTVLLNALTLLAVALMVYAPPAFAALNCFTDTNDHWAETFICWLKDNGISSGYPDGSYKPDQNITRGEMAVMLQRQADVPPSTGTVLVSTSGGNWDLFDEDGSFPPGFYIYRSIDGIKLSGVGGLIQGMVISPDLPNVLYGRSLNLVGAEICYNANFSNYITQVDMAVIRNPNGMTTHSFGATDTTDRNTTECRAYMLDNPVTLTADDTFAISAFVILDSVGINTYIDLGRVTTILQATGTTAALPKEVSQNVTVLEMLEK